MPRSTPPTRMVDIADGARRTFLTKGYARTQVADVARAVGVSPAALYRHAEGKEALFHLAFLDVVPGVDDYIATPPPGATVELITARLQRAFGGDARATAGLEAGGDAAAQLRTVIEAQFRAVADNWELLALVEASAPDRPDIAARYFHRGRRRVTADLERFIVDRIGAGSFRPVPDPALVALQIREACAWFGWHRRTDPDTPEIDDDAAVGSIVDLFVHALVAR